MSSATLNRTSFTTSRTLEYFSEKELQLQIGYSRHFWPLALVKELIDNALDACEQAKIAPVITVIAEHDAIAVQDNGPGLPVSIIERSLDYAVRVSDKSYYVSPTRGQLGNALKCVWAAPFVAQGQQGRVDIVTGGVQHQINVSLDRIAQEPRIEHTTSPDGLVKKGTLVKLHWTGLAGLLTLQINQDFYNAHINALIESYALFNPHATFVLQKPTYSTRFDCLAPSWSKWLPSNPTSPHWYTVDQLRNLITAYISDEQRGGDARTVRAFVSEFSGLSASAKQKAVTQAAGLSGAYLHDLIQDGTDVDITRISLLLAAMKAESKPIQTKALGIIGRDALTQRLCNLGYVSPDSIQYKKAEGVAHGVPYVLEVAFGMYSKDFDEYDREVRVGINWTPTIQQPITTLGRLLGDSSVDSDDPVSVVVHLTCPRIPYTDHGKTRVDLPAPITQDLVDCFKSTTKIWTRVKRQNLSLERRRKELLNAEQPKEITIKAAAYQVMEQAYLEASTNKQYPALARMMMYAARPLVLQLTGGRCWKNSRDFTQEHLPDFMKEHPTLCADWDVIYDSRGRLFEPHTGRSVDLGGLPVRRYINDWQHDTPEEEVSISLDTTFPTVGPTHRYQAVLFIEKEGFHELLMSSSLLEKYDLALMSTKGVSVTAARQLLTTAERTNISGRHADVVVRRRRRSAL